MAPSAGCSGVKKVFRIYPNMSMYSNIPKCKHTILMGSSYFIMNVDITNYFLAGFHLLVTAEKNKIFDVA